MALRKWRVQFTATLACIVLAFALGDQLVVDKPPSIDEVRPKVVIRGEEFFVPEHYPKDAPGKWQCDKKLIKELDTKTTDVLRNMCKHNPPSAQPTYKDKKSDLIYKRVFCGGGGGGGARPGPLTPTPPPPLPLPPLGWKLAEKCRTIGAKGGVSNFA